MGLALQHAHSLKPPSVLTACQPQLSVEQGFQPSELRFAHAGLLRFASIFTPDSDRECLGLSQRCLSLRTIPAYIYPEFSEEKHTSQVAAGLPRHTWIISSNKTRRLLWRMNAASRLKLIGMIFLTSCRASPIFHMLKVCVTLATSTKQSLHTPFPCCFCQKESRRRHNAP